MAYFKLKKINDEDLIVIMEEVMNRSSFTGTYCALLGGLALSLTLALPTAALAEEIWLEPAKQDAN